MLFKLTAIIENDKADHKFYLLSTVQVDIAMLSRNNFSLFL